MSEDIGQELTMDAARELGLLIKQSSFWRWMPGMLAFRFPSEAHRVIDPDASFAGTPRMVVKMFTPDLRDPATVGCVLALLREFSGDPKLSVSWHGKMGKWSVFRGRPPFMRETYDPLITLNTTREGAIVNAFMLETRAVNRRVQQAVEDHALDVIFDLITAGDAAPEDASSVSLVDRVVVKRSIKDASPEFQRFVDTAKAAVGFDRLVDTAKAAGRTTSFTRDDCQCEEEE